jgi:hypothetical protein
MDKVQELSNTECHIIIIIIIIIIIVIVIIIIVIIVTSELNMFTIYFVLKSV